MTTIRLPWTPDPSGRPLIPLTITGLSVRRFSKVLVDTGSFTTILHWRWAKYLGVVPEPAANALLWRGQPWDLGYANVELELGDDSQARLKWIASIGFTKAELDFALFGQNQSLKYFNTLMLPSERATEFTPCENFPGILGYPNTPRGVVF